MRWKKAERTRLRAQLRADADGNQSSGSGARYTQLLEVHDDEAKVPGHILQSVRTLSSTALYTGGRPP